MLNIAKGFECTEKEIADTYHKEIEAMPRWQWLHDKKVLLDPDFPHHIAQALVRRGHDIEVALDSGGLGRGQIIWRDPGIRRPDGMDGFIAVWQPRRKASAFVPFIY